MALLLCCRIFIRAKPIQNLALSCKGRNFSILNNNLKTLKKINHEQAMIQAQKQRAFLENFDCIYTFRYINQLRLMNRAKVYQTALSITFGVASIFLYDMGLITDINMTLAANASMLCALFMLLLISRQTVKVIGKMYLSKDGSTVLISHLNFWGKRRDFKLKILDIEPLASLYDLNDTIVNLRIKNADGSMYLSLTYGVNLDKDKLFKLLKGIQ
jgi:hypothetical protein